MQLKLTPHFSFSFLRNLMPAKLRVALRDTLTHHRSESMSKPSMALSSMPIKDTREKGIKMIAVTPRKGKRMQRARASLKRPRLVQGQRGQPRARPRCKPEVPTIATIRRPASTRSRTSSTAASPSATTTSAPPTSTTTRPSWTRPTGRLPRRTLRST